MGRAGGQLQAFDQSSVDAYIATDKGEKTHIPSGRLGPEMVQGHFGYHEGDAIFICPMDKPWQ